MDGPLRECWNAPPIAALIAAMRPDSPEFRKLYPFESRYLDLGGLRMHYIDEGAGDPVVMVHGNPTWSFYWRELIKALRGTHRCIAMDHIGCGLSDKPTDECRIENVECRKVDARSRDSFYILHSTFNIPYSYQLRRRVEDLESLLDSLNLNRPLTLVVHDWGGMIGLTAALRRPERIARIVVMNTAAFLLPEGDALPLRLWLLHDNPLAPLLVQGFNAFAWGATRMAVTRPLPREVRDAYLMPYDSWRNRLATLRFVQDIPLEPSHPSYALAKWTDDNLSRLSHVPMLICWGLRDFVFDETFLNEWRRRFPGAEVHAFEDAGHYVMEDAQAMILKQVTQFLSCGHAS